MKFTKSGFQRLRCSGRRVQCGKWSSSILLKVRRESLLRESNEKLEC